MNDPRLQAFIQSLILSVLIVIAFASFGSDAASPSLSGENPGLEARISRLESALEDLHNSLAARPGARSQPQASAMSPTREAVESDSPEISKSLRHELDELRRMISYAQPQSVSQHTFQFEKVRRSAPTNTRALAALSKEVSESNEADSKLRKHLLYATQDEILHRFGRPTSIGAGEVAQGRFMYYHGDEFDISFEFLNGHVVGIE